MLRLALVAVLVVVASPSVHAAPPAWPDVPLGEGETALSGTFPSTVTWLAGDGTPVTFRVVFAQRGKKKQLVVRAATPAGLYDLATSDFPDAEFFVFDHENGTTAGLQLHWYKEGPDQYQGWVVRWTGKKLEVTKKTRFNGLQPQPAWLVDSARIPDRARVRRAIQTMRWGAHRADANAFGHFFDGERVQVRWRTVAADGTSTTREEALTGTELRARLVADGLPQLGHNATCKALCCTADTKPLAAYARIENICFDGEPTEILEFPHVRAIEIAQPTP